MIGAVQVGDVGSRPLWTKVPLGHVLRQRKEFVSIDDLREYKRCRVQLHAQGIMLRDAVRGSEIKTKKQQVCRAGEFLVAEIDAKVGGVGIVPPNLDGAIVSSHYFLFEIDRAQLDPQFLRYFVKTAAFQQQVVAEGSTNYAAVRPADVLSYWIPLHPLDEQRRIVARIEAFAVKLEAVRTLWSQQEAQAGALLLKAYSEIIEEAVWLPMGEVAPLGRRPVVVEADQRYLEIGVRSFGKGTFHKPPVAGAALGNKRIFSIEPGDLLFNIVFAWEGAVAVARPQDAGRVGSHRFLTCLPRRDLTTAEFLRFHFLTARGLADLGAASPGGAGRNRTLGIKALEEIRVPVPGIGKQAWFDTLQFSVSALGGERAQNHSQLALLLPSVLSRAFSREL